MKIHISWNEVDLMVQELVRQIRLTSDQSPSIFGIPRGGLIPAVMLSHHLGIPLVNKPSQRTLVVDEIADTGQTLKTFTQRSAVLIWKKSSVVKPSFHGRQVDSDRWIVFPWEIDT